MTISYQTRYKISFGQFLQHSWYFTDLEKAKQSFRALSKDYYDVEIFEVKEVIQDNHVISYKDIKFPLIVGKLNH